MIDLHMHTVFSDGELVPAELARRAQAAGCRCIAITDHVDISNVEFVAASLARFAEDNRREIKVFPGVEITHVPPRDIARIAEMARKAGAAVVVVHGETVVEPVERGTNSAAIDAGVDILAHPGLITVEEAKRAAAAGVALELSGRSGHSFTNGHVARTALEAGATLVFNTDAHSPRDIMGREMAIKVVVGAGLDEKTAASVLENSKKMEEAISGKV